MAKTKYYAVKLGYNPGIFTTWKETQEQVNGYSGAVYKSFSTIEEAEEYLLAGDNSDNKIANDSNSAITNKDIDFRIYKEPKCICSNQNKWNINNPKTCR